MRTTQKPNRNISIFGDVIRHGSWPPADRQTSIAVFGDVDVDVHDAPPPDGDVTLRVIAPFGDIAVRLPRDIAVDAGGFTIFGSKRVFADGPPATGPTVHVRGFTLFGSLRVLERLMRAALAAAALVVASVAVGCGNDDDSTEAEPETAPSSVTDVAGAEPVTVAVEGPADQNRSEPHIAVDPEDPDRLYVVAEGSLPAVSLDPQLFWRSEDGGRTWSEPLLMGSVANGPEGAGGDPVVAAGPGGAVAFAALAVTPDLTAQTLDVHIGTRVSTDAGTTFPAFGTAARLLVTPASREEIDKEWMAVDATGGPFNGFVYLSWFHVFPDGAVELLHATSRDSGRTYGAPVVLEPTRPHDEAVDPPPTVQLAVRPDGSVAAVWDTVHDGRPALVQATSHDGGATFTPAERIVPLDAHARREGFVPSLAVSPEGRGGLCWSQARSAADGLPAVSCASADEQGWSAPVTVLSGSTDREYLPAVAFVGETLWVVLYVSDDHETRLLAVPQEGDGFGEPLELLSWPVPSDVICAPHPPACRPDQTFIGDYIGAVGTPDGLFVASIEPVPGEGGVNGVLVTRVPQG